MEKIIFLIFYMLLVISCSIDETHQFEEGSLAIVGADCNDGANFDATGQGACSLHDSVMYW